MINTIVNSIFKISTVYTPPCTIHNFCKYNIRFLHFQPFFLEETHFFYSPFINPEIDAGDDLTKYPAGTARILLYHLKVVSGEVTETKKEIKTLDYVKTLIDDLIKRVEEAGFREASVEDGGIVFKYGWTDAYTTTGSLFSPTEQKPYCKIEKSGIFCVLRGLKAWGHEIAELNQETKTITIFGDTITVLPEKYRPKSELKISGKALYWQTVIDQLFGTHESQYSQDIEITIGIDGSVSFSSTSATLTYPILDDTHPCGISIPMQFWEVQL